MKIVLQRVTHASVEVENQIVGSIGTGLLALVGFGEEDLQTELPAVARKIAEMRLFPDESGRFDRSLQDVSGELLVVSQFTLFADLRRGRRPDFGGALAPQEAEKLYDKFLEVCREILPDKVQAGVFGAKMKVALENNGPVTILFDSNLHLPRSGM